MKHVPSPHHFLAYGKKYPTTIVKSHIYPTAKAIPESGRISDVYKDVIGPEATLNPSINNDTIVTLT